MTNYVWIILSIIPLILLCIMVYYILKTFTEKLMYQQKLDLKLKNIEILTPQKFQAYERMALFLERIRPTSLVRRIKAENDLHTYERNIISGIQEEFDHNLSQQIYINPETWRIIYSAKNATQSFVKQCKDSLAANATASDLQTEIIKRSIDATEPSSNALLKIQGDIQGNI